MRRLGILLIMLLIAAALIFVYGKDYLPFIEKPSDDSKYEVVRHFPFSSEDGLEGWEKKLLGQKKTEYILADHGGVTCLKAVSDDSASALYYKQPLSYEKDPFVSWDWKAEKFPEFSYPETLKDKDEFDFVAQVYVVFHAKFFLNMKAIQYVWCKELPVGDSGPSPYTKNVRLLVLESGPSEVWKHERRDLKKDFKDLFGEDLASNVEAVSVMTDSDSTESTASACYKDITLGYIGREEHIVGRSGKEDRRLELPRLPRIPLFRREEAEPE